MHMIAFCVVTSICCLFFFFNAIYIRQCILVKRACANIPCRLVGIEKLVSGKV